MTGSTRILGIDPGLRIAGYGCLDCSGPDERIVEAGVLRLGRGDQEPGARRVLDAGTISSRLAELDRDLRDLLARLKPGIVAVEQLFAHPKHPATSIIMGHARGVILLAVRNASLELVEVRPNEVKKSLTGFGHAGKGQMQDAVQAYFRLETTPKPPDVADAIAIALCAAVKQRFGIAAGTPARKKGGRSLKALPAEVRAQIERQLNPDEPR